jgi:putative SOS response-associated peptidase YedK
MCGRFVQKKSVLEYGALFHAKMRGTGRPPSFNVSPGQPVLAVRRKAPEDPPELWTPLWGLIPRWARERTSLRPINARIETVSEKPAFRDSFRHRRCLVPAEGYYEWMALEEGKQPFWFHRPDGGTLALAGLWDTWEEPGGTQIDTVALLVRPARREIAPIHDRMPVLLPEESWKAFLDPSLSDPPAIRNILEGDDTVPLLWHPVGKSVNNPKNDGEELIRPLLP